MAKPKKGVNPFAKTAKAPAKGGKVPGKAMPKGKC